MFTQIPSPEWIRFQFKGVEFMVIASPAGEYVYRAAAHFGGPWSNCEATIANTSIDPLFRKLLRSAVAELRALTVDA